MRRLGVAIVVQDVDKTAGMERQARQLAERLVRRGARVAIVSTVETPSPLAWLRAGPRLVERRGRLAIYRVPLFASWWWDRCMSLFELGAALVVAARASSLDVVYAVHWTGGLHAAPAARLAARPLFVKFAGGGEYGDLASIARSEERARALETLAEAERLVCISPQIAEEARSAGLAAEKLLSVPNGVSVERFARAKPAALPGSGDAEHVLFVGALRKEKRLPELVRAFALLARRRPRAQLVLAGEGPEAPAIREAARDLGVSERVHLLGERRDVPALLAAARVFVLVSASEGLSNALLEALAAGAPIVATDIEGNRAVVTHERDALLVAPGDEAALASAMERLLEDRALASRLAAAGRERVLAYDFEAVAARYEAAFRAARRPARGTLAVLGRWLAGFGHEGLARFSLSIASFYARRAVSNAVLAGKRALGLARV